MKSQGRSGLLLVRFNLVQRSSEGFSLETFFIYKGIVLAYFLPIRYNFFTKESVSLSTLLSRLH